MQRTDEERERDRLERERRRAQREGAAPPPIPDQAPPPLDPLPADDPPPTAPDPAPEPPVWQPQPEPPLTEEFEPAPGTEPEFAQPQPRAPAWQVEPSEPARATPASQPPPAQPPPISPLRQTSRAGGPPRKHRLTGARIAALVALVLAAALVWFLISLFQPFAGDGSGRVIVTIPKGSSSSKIGSILAREGVVSSGFFFDLRALVEGKRGSLHSGRFQLKHGMSYSAAIDALSKPPPKVISLKVTIPEGYTRRQIAQLVHEDALSGEYLAASERSALLSPHRYGAPRGTRTLEGFLFPATYELRAGAPVQRLVNEQLIAFRRRFGSKDVRRAHALGVTPYELLTVASLIEREAQSEHDRPLIAAVIYNRLREGIPIGIDAAIYYAVEERMGIATYTGELTASQLKIDSPYNTRTHKGLPPTPISNPGEASIEAAAHPAHVPYLYYVAGADGCGEQVFSKTEAEFEKNVAAYDAAVKKNGGHPPKCKKR